MARPDVLDCEVSIKMASRQLKFLEDKAKELGISKEEVIRRYIASYMEVDAEREDKESETKQFSLMGLVRDGRVTDADIDEVISEWNKTELP